MVTITIRKCAVSITEVGSLNGYTPGFVVELWFYKQHRRKRSRVL